VRIPSVCQIRPPPGDLMELRIWQVSTRESPFVREPE
jgi:hypothetical protein